MLNGRVDRNVLSNHTRTRSPLNQVIHECVQSLTFIPFFLLRLACFLPAPSQVKLLTNCIFFPLCVLHVTSFISRKSIFDTPDLNNQAMRFYFLFDFADCYIEFVIVVFSFELWNLQCLSWDLESTSWLSVSCIFYPQTIHCNWFQSIVCMRHNFNYWKFFSLIGDKDVIFWGVN